MPTSLTLKRLTAPIVSTRAASDGGLPSIIISTETSDRDRDIIVQAGIAVPAKVPVTFCHDYNELPVGEKVRHETQMGRTRMWFRWLEGDERASRVRNAFEQNMLSASVGLRVLEQDPNQHGGWTIKRSDLIEVALCTVPANPEATRSLLKGLGWYGNREGFMPKTLLDGHLYLEITDFSPQPQTPGEILHRQAIADYRAWLAMEKRWRVEDEAARRARLEWAKRALAPLGHGAPCPRDFR